MSQHNFKIGDEVRVRDSSRWKKRIKDTIGVVRGIKEGEVFVKWRTKRCVVCGIEALCGRPANIWWHKLHNIEPVINVGGQLTFSFMTP